MLKPDFCKSSFANRRYISPGRVLEQSYSSGRKQSQVRTFGAASLSTKLVYEWYFHRLAFLRRPLAYGYASMCCERIEAIQRPGRCVSNCTSQRRFCRCQRRGYVPCKQPLTAPGLILTLNIFCSFVSSLGGSILSWNFTLAKACFLDEASSAALCARVLNGLLARALVGREAASSVATTLGNLGRPLPPF